MILFDEISGVKNLQCSYDNWSPVLWPSNQYCEITVADLSSSQKSNTFSFSGTPAEKEATKTVYFFLSPKTEFIPLDIFREFPSVNGLVITSSNLPVLKNDLFSSEFAKIEYLHLGSNKIKSIEPEAFKELVNLKWLALFDNNIEVLDSELFKTNTKLEFISFNANKISRINSNLFKGLSSLKNIDFEDNVCFNQEIGCPTCSITQSELNQKLSSCF